MNRAPIDEWLKKSHQYLNSLEQESRLKKQRESLRDDLKQFIMWGEPDESGNYNYDFPDPISIDGETFYKGLQAQRRVSEYVDEDTAYQVIDTAGLWDRCVKEITSYEIDFDELYAANQEGLVSDEDIDSILQHDVSYSLVKVKR